MARARDAYSGIRADWLMRQHIKLVRKRIREAKKKADQLTLALPPPRVTEDERKIWGYKGDKTKPPRK